MNYLAHAVLSGNDSQIMAGNLLADRIKGSLPTDLPAKVALGVRLHRRLDAFTDNHLVFKRSRARLSASFGHFSGIVVDVVYDHILAGDMELYTGQSLDAFVAFANKGFVECKGIIPNYLGPNWTSLGWLREYANEAGLERAFSRIAARARRPLDFGNVMSAIRPHLEEMSGDFAEFFPQAVGVQDAFLANEQRLR